MVLASRSAFGLLVAAAVLYLARHVLIPLALAILLAFLLAPVARRLESWRLGRLLATLVTVAIAFTLIAGIGAVATRQALSLAAKLPEYRHNIVAKIRAVREPEQSRLGKAAEAIKELESEAAPAAAAPLPVTETPPSALAALRGMVEPFVQPIGTALAVIVFTILFLLNRENMRERLIGLIGARRINVTTQALSEASYRVSRYLYMQLVVNMCFGIPFGIALYFIGIPNAMLWGLLGTLLRFIPYAGVWIAVALPTALAFAIFDGWSEVAWVIGVFVALELVLVNAIEPWLYGRSAGLSPIAIIAAALFWTWLWGPVGLLLAVPLTVCIVVMGRYIPEMGWLNVLLGVEPVLSPDARFYQRLVAFDQEEAVALAAEHAAQHGVPATYETILIPALSLAEEDRAQGTLDGERARFVVETTRLVLEQLGEAAPPAAAHARVCIVPAHDAADELAGAMLARLLPGARLLSSEQLSGETLEELGRDPCGVVCISAVPPQAGIHAAHRVRRLKKAFPRLKLVVALWSPEDPERAKARIVGAGADEVVTRMDQAVAELRQRALTTA